MSEAIATNETSFDPRKETPVQRMRRHALRPWRDEGPGPDDVPGCPPGAPILVHELWGCDFSRDPEVDLAEIREFVAECKQKLAGSNDEISTQQGWREPSQSLTIEGGDTFAPGSYSTSDGWGWAGVEHKQQ